MCLLFIIATMNSYGISRLCKDLIYLLSSVLFEAIFSVYYYIAHTKKKQLLAFIDFIVSLKHQMLQNGNKSRSENIGNLSYD